MYPQAGQGTSATVRNFTSGSSSGEATSPSGIGSPHRAQSTSTYHLPDMGKSPGLAPNLYTPVVTAALPRLVQCRVDRYRGRFAGPQYPQLALEISWKLNRTTCRLTPVVQGEINGSKLWSSATHKQRWLSRIPLAATDLGILHGRHHRRGRSFAPLVISSPLA